MRYQLVKIDKGKPYKSPDSGGPRAKADSLQGAKSLQAILTVATSDGWVIIDTEKRGIENV
jgi:hypothetical protein